MQWKLFIWTFHEVGWADQCYPVLRYILRYPNVIFLHLYLPVLYSGSTVLFPNLYSLPGRYSIILKLTEISQFVAKQFNPIPNKTPLHAFIPFQTYFPSLRQRASTCENAKNLISLFIIKLAYHVPRARQPIEADTYLISYFRNSLTFSPRLRVSEASCHPKMWNLCRTFFYRTVQHRTGQNGTPPKDKRKIEIILWLMNNGKTVHNLKWDPNFDRYCICWFEHEKGTSSAAMASGRMDDRKP